MLKEEIKKPSVKNKVEAVLFSAGHKISIDEICRLCRSRKEDVIPALQELKKEYEEKQSSLMLVEEGDVWKFTVREAYMPMVRRIVTETELTKSVLETLAVIAFKYPILQSDLIKIRTNKAYEHLVELEKAGYITRQKHSRTNLIKLTEKFFKYFDLTEDKLRDKFKDFESIARAIKEKEEDVEKIKEEQIKKAEELKKQDEKIKKEIESLDKSEEKFEIPLETYGAESPKIISQDFVQEGSLIVEKQKIGELEVVEEKKAARKEPEAKEKKEKEQIQVDNKIHEIKKPQIFAEEFAEEKAEARKKKSEGIKLSPEMEAKVEQKVEEMLHPTEKTYGE